MSQEAIQTFVTFPNRESAESVAKGLVEHHLAACVQILGPIDSVYRWQGQVESAKEWLCLVKTSREAFEKVADFIRQQHPYEVPEIIAVPICKGFPPYMQWLFQSLESQ